MSLRHGGRLSELAGRHVDSGARRDYNRVNGKMTVDAGREKPPAAVIDWHTAKEG